MKQVVNGKDSVYIIMNPKLIFQRSYDKLEKFKLKNIVHFTPKSISNAEDRSKVELQLSNYDFQEILYSVVAD